MAIPNIVEGQIALDPINGIFYYIDSSGAVVSSTLNFLQASNTLITTADGLSVNGNLVVSGNVVSVNTETLVVEDANIELGTVSSASNTTADGGGITLKGSTDKTFLWSNATKSWTSSENIDLAAGKIISINGVQILSANAYSGSAAKWSNARVVTVSGHLSGSVSIDGSTDVILTTSIVANSVELGTHTTGNYVSSLTAGNGISISNNSGENTTPTISLNAGLSNLNDVTLSNVANGDFFRYNGSTWINDKIDLSTDTIGNYVDHLVAGTGVAISNNSGEASSPTIEIGQSVATNANVIFNQVNAELHGNVTGNVNGNLSGNVTGDLTGNTNGTHTGNVTGTASNALVWANQRRITLDGDVTGNVFINGSADVTISTTISANSVSLGADTTGDYVANLVSGTGITITDNNGEGMSPVVKISNAYTTAMVANIANAEANAGNYAQSMASTAYSNAVTYINNRTLDDLSGVSISSTAVNDVLLYNGSSWVNDDISIAKLSDVNTNNVLNGQILLWNNTSGKWVNSTIPEQPQGSSISVTRGNGTNADFTIFHGLDTADIVVVVKSNVTYEVIETRWSTTDSLGAYSQNHVTVNFTTPPAEDEMQITVYGAVQSTAVVITGRLDNLSGDVMISGSSSGDMLVYNGSKWINRKISLSTDLNDVLISNISANQVLKFNGTNWVNSVDQSGVSAINQLSDVSVNSAISGDFLKYNGSTWINDAINLGTDTTGNYMSSISAGSGVSVSHTPGEGSSATVSLNATINDLTDVVISNATNGEILLWNGTNWINDTIISNPHQLDELQNVSISNALNAGEFLKYDGALWVNDAINLGTDTTGNYVAGIIGTENQISISGSEIESATVTIGLPANVTIANNLTVNGDLTVSGNTTTLNTANLNVEDNFILLNSGVTGSPSLNAGLEIERGSDSNAILRWNETNNKWELTDGVTYGDIITTSDTEIITNAMIADGVITNAKISSSSAISLSKLASGSSSQIVVANTTGVPTYVTVSGDVSVASSGTITINSNTVTNTQLQEGPARGGFNSQLNNATLSSDNYTLQASDLAKLVVIDSTANATVTVGNILTTGDRIDILRANTGEVTFTAASGVVLNSTPGLKLRAQWSSATIVKLQANSWVVIGDLKA